MAPVTPESSAPIAPIVDKWVDIIYARVDTTYMKNTTDTTGKYEIKCDDCKVTIGRTDSVGRSAQGGRCAACKSAIDRLSASWKPA
jgi:predicted SprT family Zn-dependent metalloprotease